MPPALSRDPEVARDKIARLRLEIAHRDNALREITADLIALTDGMDEVSRMLRDTSSGQPPTARIAKARIRIAMLIKQHGRFATGRESQG